ncbi:TPA: rhamnogalacturonan acetylesterase, partial [Candidatus Sumerlaeota bacterium]|nr:rhamnogalacturonan acetylesterase [Candidatus Sumerlaeota bacterium]
TYKANLKRTVASTREKGGMPVLITSMERMAGVDKDTLENYPATVCEVAKEDNVPLIDLHAKSRVFYKALGGDLKKAFQDGTHHNNYGSYELAKCVVQGIRDNKLDIAKYISDDVERFDPAHPDSVEKFDMPASPGTSGAKPLGD